MLALLVALQELIGSNRNNISTTQNYPNLEKDMNRNSKVEPIDKIKLISTHKIPCCAAISFHNIYTKNAQMIAQPLDINKSSNLLKTSSNLYRMESHNSET